MRQYVTVRSRPGSYWPYIYHNDGAPVDTLAKLADQAGVALPTLAVAWTLRNPVITSPIIGASKVEQLDATLAAVDYEIDDDLYEQLNAVTTPYRRGDAPR